MKNAEALPRQPTWLPTLCARYSDLISALLAAPLTIIHGEYYPQNVLMYEGVPCPVDWESAAIAAGELDLASLTDRWPEDIVRDCVNAYQEARWLSTPPTHFYKTLQIARVYTQLRWLGDWNELNSKDCGWRFERLRSYGEQLALI